MAHRPQNHQHPFRSRPTTEELVSAKTIGPAKRPLPCSDDFTSAATALADHTNLASKRTRVGGYAFRPPPNGGRFDENDLNVAPDLLGNEYTPSQTETQKPYWPQTFSQALPSTAQAPGGAAWRATTNTRSLAHTKWGLKWEAVLGFKEHGITEMYSWQEECLSLPGLLTGEKNVVYTAPTSSGKSLVADILTIKKVMETRQKAIIIVPYVSIVQEKTRFLKKVFGKLQLEFPPMLPGDKPRRRPLNIVGYHSGTKTRIGWNEVDIAICTTEKANAMINSAAIEHKIDQLGLVVFDELHMLDDEHRGFIIELLATKLLCLSQPIQLIGMSATLSNVDVMAKWLRAHFYNCTFRPIPLVEHIVHKDEVQTYEGKISHRIAPSPDKRLKDSFTNAIVKLATIPLYEDHGVLVFCESKSRCESLAMLLSDFTPHTSNDAILEKRYDLVRELATGIAGMDPTLEKTLPRGVAFHHAGMTTEERELVAKAYDEGVIKLICCTPTMAAGVNLPARRVVIYPKTGREYATPALIRQMRGRAGRAGRDTYGETFIVCREKEFADVKALLQAEMPSVSSCLANEHSSAGLSRALLEVVTTRLANSPFSIDEYFRSTLLYHLNPDQTTLPKMLHDALSNLKAHNLIEEESPGYWIPTKIGQATVAGGFSPTDGVFLHKELSKALQNFNLETDVQITYQLTPIHGTSTPHDLRSMRWEILRDALDGFDDASLRAATFITVNPGLVNKMAMIGGHLDETTPASHDIARTHRRFYLSLLLRDLINESPVHKVATKYHAPRGAVQQLASTARGFAATSAIYCRVMGWSGLAVLLDHYAERLDLGVKDDLVDLARLPFVKSATARVFHENGLRNVEMVAKEGKEKIMEILWSAQPRRLQILAEKDEKMRARVMERAAIVVRAAQRLWDAECLVELDE